MLVSFRAGPKWETQRIQIVDFRTAWYFSLREANKIYFIARLGNT